jgi:pimeloyl-ACP methyl ester carboxylesterase
VIPRRSVKQLVQQIPHADVRWIEGAGHLLPLQRPTEIAAILREPRTLTG